jgi:ParB family transcriptional regulator, chromosome partitioning protein
MADEPSRARLGRGLAALIGESNDAIALSAAPERALRGTRKVNIAYIQANPHNPRKDFREEDLVELTDSIREKGLIQPLAVRSLGGNPETFQIIAGERRWRASQRAGLHELPVHILDVSDKEALELAIIENVQRADLNPIEEGLGYQQLMENFGYSQYDLAKVIGKSRPHIANTTRLLGLPETVKNYLREGKLTAGHARALLTEANPAEMADKIVREGLSVRQTEGLKMPSLEQVGQAIQKQLNKSEKSIEVQNYEQHLEKMVGLKNSIIEKGEGGEVKIFFKTQEQFQMLIRRLTGAGF